MIDIIIPNYNGRENLELILNSLCKQTYRNYHIIVVDNASSDGSQGYIQVNFPEVILIENNFNLGFAKSINIGVEYSLKNTTSNYILLLNNDIELTKEFLKKGIRTFGLSKDIGCVAVKMINFFERDLIDDTGDFIKSNGGTPLARGMGEKDNKQYDKPEYIFGACAGAAFYKREVFETVGLFDTDFFAYLEDIDFSFRLQLMSYKCYYNPDIICYHKRGDTTKKFEGLRTYFTEKNLVAVRLKNYPTSIYLKYSLLFLISRTSRYFKFFFYYPKGTFASAFKGYLKGILEIPVSLKKRKSIQRKKKVTAKYIESLFK